MFKLICFLSFLLTTSCSSVRVKSDYDQNFDFTKLKTYAKAHPEPNDNLKTQKTLVTKRVLRMIKEELDQKGYVLTSREKADFLMDYRFSSRDVVVPAAIQPSVAFGYGSHRYYGGYGVGVGYNYGSYQTETVDTLVLDVWDSKTKEHIWSAKVEDELVKSNADKTDEAFQKVISNMLDKFPPKERK